MQAMSGAHPDPAPLHVRFDVFELDEGNARLLRQGNAVALAPTPFGLLCALARRAGSLLGKHALLDEVWGHRFVSDSVLKGAISDIRTALGDDPRQPRFIETVPRRGYRFVAVPVAAPAPGPPAARAAAIGDALASTGAAAGVGFVGRGRELATLAAAWERARNGARVIAWVAGEPGVGKTTLIERFIGGLDDVMCAVGQCVQGFGASEPCHALLDAVASLARRDPAVAPLLRAVAPTWLLQLPWLSDAGHREALQRELVGVSPERMLREFGEFLDRYTVARPLLLVTEDLHWADRATIQLIDYMARRQGSASVLWLSTFRLTEVLALEHPLHALRHALRVHDRCVELVLDAFNERETADYLSRHQPSLADDQAFVRALHEHTDGVPLFVASFASAVASRPGLDAPRASLARLPVPHNLEALVGHYLARLDSEGRALLAAAAVSGARFRVQTLALALGRDPLEVGERCESLAREQFWLVEAAAEPGACGSSQAQYAFRHALHRQALIDRMGAATRTEWHRRVAIALEKEAATGVPIPAAVLAGHFEQAGQPGPALPYFAEAARSALRQLNPHECLALTERALQLLPQALDGQSAGHELELATLRGVAAFHAHGAGDLARGAFERAAARLGAAPDHPMRGLLLHGFGFLLCLRAEYDQALLTAARAQALGDASGDALLVVAAGTVQGQVHNVQGRPEAARRALERVLPALAELPDAAETRLLGFIADPKVTAHALLSLPLLHLGRVRQARTHLDAALTRARALGQPLATMIALWCEALCEIRLGDAERVGSLARQLLELVERHGLAQGRTASRWFLGWAEAQRGRPREGFAAIRDAHDQNLALGMYSGSSETLGYAAQALLAADDLDGAEAQVDAARACADRTDERIYLPQLLLIEAAIARRRGNPVAAVARLHSAVAEARSQGADWLELLALTELLERAPAAADERTALRALVDRLDEEAGDTRPVVRARALLERPEPPATV